MIFHCSICDDIIIVRMHRIHASRSASNPKSKTILVCGSCYSQCTRICQRCRRTFHHGSVIKVSGMNGNAYLCRECLAELRNEVEICRECHEAFMVNFSALSSPGLRRHLCPVCRMYARTCRICGREFVASSSSARERSTCGNCREYERYSGERRRQDDSMKPPKIKFKKNKELTSIIDDPGSEM